MNEKASQKTEDEVLDQTFGGFDEEMTEQTVDPTQTGATAGTEKKKKSGSSNTMVFVGAGVAAVAVLGWMFVIKPSMTPPPQPVAQVQQAAPVVNTPPVQAPVQPPVAQATIPNPTAPETPESKAAAQFLSGQQGTPQTPSMAVVTPDTGTNPSVTVAVTTPATTASAPNNVTKTTVTTTSTGVGKDNATSAAMVNELGNLFESQSKEFKVALTDVGNKVQSLETFRDEQKVTNKNVDDRLGKLETGGVRHIAVASNSGEKSMVRKATVKSTSNNVLVDKTEVVERKSVRTVKETAVAANDGEPMVEYNIHSIFGNRVWFKNADGSLSTYAAGDRLPSGELVKKIDDEKFAVTTDKRTFVKK